MQIKAREVVVKVVDEINLTPEQWDSRGGGTLVWREHMAKILNTRVKKLAPQCSEAIQFYTELSRFSQEIGFGEDNVVVAIAEHIYHVTFSFEAQAA